jgi:pimeloyl-ACP methyl ester carboxylesterase
MTQPALALVLLPGMDGGGELFAAFIAALERAGAPFATIVISYPPDQALSYASLTQFVRARLPADGAYIVLGESFSGPIAISLAASRPPGMVGLILCCTFARNPTPLFAIFKHFLGVLPIFPAASVLLAPFLLGTRSTAPLRAALRSAIARVSAPVMRHRLRSVLDVDYSAQMRDVTMPILYLQASQDRVVLPSAARYLKTLQPSMAVIRLEGPHLLLQTAPGAAAATVQTFAKEIQAYAN